jgi:Ni/Fe-hydrogenase b-type cytochrome subunit
MIDHAVRNMPDEAHARPPAKGGDLAYKHRLPTRLWHWINALAVIVLLMSGLMISNAHPHLYWGLFGANLDQPWYNPPDFPGWATIPSTYNLALARTWHFFFAWIFAFGLLAHMVVGLVNRHIQRDLTLKRLELAPAHLWQDVKDHARLRFPTGAAALSYNVIQKMTYIAVLFVLLPGMILSGLSLSPGFNAVMHWPLDLVGGRATMRSLHFITAGLIAAFIVVHILLVVLAGPYNEIRSMITGRFRVPPGPGEPNSARERWMPRLIGDLFNRRARATQEDTA